MVCIYVFMCYIYMHTRNNVYHLYHKFPTIPPSRPCQIGAWKIHFHPNPDIFQAFVLKSEGGYVSRYIYIFFWDGIQSPEFSKQNVVSQCGHRCWWMQGKKANVSTQSSAGPSSLRLPGEAGKRGEIWLWLLNENCHL